MNKRTAVFVSSSFLLALCAAAMGDENGAGGQLVLARMGLMYVGGREIHMQGGGRFAGASQTQIVEQAPVHYLLPPESKQQGRPPVVMVPGMGLTSYLYLGTPDGRDGWAQLFAKAGYPVYVFDEPNNAVSGFDVSAFSGQTPDAYRTASPSRFMLWSNEIVWRRWGIGPEPGVPFTDTRYPVAQIDQLYSSMTPVCTGSKARAQSGSTDTAGQRMSRGGRARRSAAVGQGDQATAPRNHGGGGRGSSGLKAAALVALLEKTGPAVLVVHSASGSTGLEATRMRPDLITAIVAVEIVGSPTDPEDVKKHFADKRFIAVFGDHFDVRPMAGRCQACQTTARIINEAGGKADVIWLPKLGIRGNTHLMMQDNNNDSIARMIIEKLAN